MGGLPRRLVVLAMLASLLPGSPARAAEDRTSSLTVTMRLPYAGGTELATDGRYVYAGQFNGRFERDELPRQGGVRIFDTQASPPRLVGTIACAGTDMDVAIARPGLLVVAHHRSSCGVAGNGVTTFDVSDPRRPRRLGTVKVPSAHTLTALPGTSYVYVSPGGLGNGYGFTSVVDVKDARHPRVAKYLRFDVMGCHDTTFARNAAGTLLGVCTGGDGVRIWDMTDPLSPRELSYVSRDDNPRLYFAHGAAISPDGALLVVNDEAYGGHSCDGTASYGGYGSLHLYDVTRPETPVYLGAIHPPRGAVPAAAPRRVETWCTSHQLNFAPTGRRLVNAWFSGGVSVWDLTVPLLPREEAHYVGQGAVAWTAHWIGDRIWVNDMARGVEVLELSPVPALPLPVSPAFTPAPLVLARPPAPRPATRPAPSLLCPLPVA
ncbi:MAG TPA: hypothetical protein VGX28_08685 [Frankiaceae bacterium]|jgi:hypothetical protein|nr:hypothetical protein [Frankiaceae bacterium]